MEWFKPEVKGTPPTPRYSHTFNFYEDGNYAIVHGGRNDYSSSSFALNDTYLLELTKLEWIKVIIYSEPSNIHIFSRCGHSAVVHSKYFLIHKQIS
jgi:hypothetical protein